MAENQANNSYDDWQKCRELIGSIIGRKIPKEGSFSHKPYTQGYFAEKIGILHESDYSRIISSNGGKDYEYRRIIPPLETLRDKIIYEKKVEKLQDELNKEKRKNKINPSSRKRTNWKLGISFILVGGIMLLVGVVLNKYMTNLKVIDTKPKMYRVIHSVGDDVADEIGDRAFDISTSIEKEGETFTPRQKESIMDLCMNTIMNILGESRNDIEAKGYVLQRSINVREVLEAVIPVNEAFECTASQLASDEELPEYATPYDRQLHAKRDILFQEVQISKAEFMKAIKEAVQAEQEKLDAATGRAYDAFNRSLKESL